MDFSTWTTRSADALRMKRLAAGGDPVVLAWLARSAPQLVLAKGEGAMTPELAMALVESAETEEDELLRVARAYVSRRRAAGRGPT